MRKPDPAINEVKTRLTDRAYDALQTFKQLHGIESDSAALSRITSLFLLGHVGTLPAQLVAGSVRVGAYGT